MTPGCSPSTPGLSLIWELGFVDRALEEISRLQVPQPASSHPILEGQQSFPFHILLTCVADITNCLTTLCCPVPQRPTLPIPTLYKIASSTRREAGKGARGVPIPLRGARPFLQQKPTGQGLQGGIAPLCSTLGLEVDLGELRI